MDTKELLLRLVRAIKKLLLTSPDQTAELEAAKADARAAHEELAALQAEQDAEKLTDAERAEVEDALNLVAAAEPPDTGDTSSGPSGATGPEGSDLPAPGEGTGAAVNGAFVTGAGVVSREDRGEAMTSPDIQSAGATGSEATGASGDEG